MWYNHNSFSFAMSTLKAPIYKTKELKGCVVVILNQISPKHLFLGKLSRKVCSPAAKHLQTNIGPW